MTTGTAACVVVHATAAPPGAISILQLVGDVLPVLAAVTGEERWPVGRVRLAALADIDDGLVGRLTPGTAQLMPHGGPRVIQRLLARLEREGVEITSPRDIDARACFPEAADEDEVRMLEALARAHSPLAVDLLLDQPRRWRLNSTPTAEDRARSRRLDRLLEPPLVVLAGPPNVGKSTLSNTLFGRAVSITQDAPGTTRDYTWGLLELAGLVVRWHDTPGLGDTFDAIELRAIEIARRVMDGADLLIAVTDADHPWPELSRPPHLRVAARADLGARDDADLAVSAVTGQGLETLVRTVRDRLVPPADLAHPGPWWTMVGSTKMGSDLQ